MTKVKIVNTDSIILPVVNTMPDSELQKLIDCVSSQLKLVHKSGAAMMPYEITINLTPVNSEVRFAQIKYTREDQYVEMCKEFGDAPWEM